MKRITDKCLRYEIMRGRATRESILFAIGIFGKYSVRAHELPDPRIVQSVL